MRNILYETFNELYLMILQLNDRIKQFIASSTQPVAVLDHVRVQVNWCWKTSITNIAGNVLVIWKIFI